MNISSSRSAWCQCLLFILYSFPALCSAGVPVIYSTDLYHPHDDPDDHYDLATLFALPELDVKGIIIDMANIREKRGYHETEKKPGIVALRQMFHLSGKTVPFAVGLDRPLRSAEDKALNQPASAQGAVRMILSTLRESEETTCIFTVGSLVDVAAAYNRDPELLRRKVRAIYVNAGTGPDGYQEEWNVHLDRHAFRRVMLSDLPVRWYPCFGRENYLTHFRVDQTEIVGACADPLRAFFAYALNRSNDEPISFLLGTFPPPAGPRNMWCTPSFIDLAGRRIYETDRGFEALAQPPTPNTTAVNCYRMRPVQLAECDGPLKTSQNGIVTSYLGCDDDRVGKLNLEPDGAPDCLVRVDGLAATKTVRNATLNGPREGIWLNRPNSKRWVLRTTQDNGALFLSFSFWARGAHTLNITFHDNSRKTIKFNVPTPDSPCFRANIDAADSNAKVLEKQEPAYTKVLSSCLKNLLGSYPLNSAASGDGRRPTGH